MTLKMVLTAPKPMLVILRLSKENDAAHTLYNGPSDKVGTIQRAGCLIR